MKLLRTIRLDPSDTFVFERAAEPGEWAVSGGFVFVDADPGQLPGKARAAYARAVKLKPDDAALNEALAAASIAAAVPPGDRAK